MRYETELAVIAVPLTVDDRLNLYHSGIRCNACHTRDAAFILSRECTLKTDPPTRVSLVTLPFCWQCIRRFLPATAEPLVLPGMNGGAA